MAHPAEDNEMDLRRAARHRAEFTAVAECKNHGDQAMHIINVSAHGFMIDNNVNYERGDRVELRLPGVGRIEALVIWTLDARAGFQFERVVRLPDFMTLLEKIAPKRG